MSFLFGGFRNNNGEEHQRPNTGYPSENDPPSSVFTRLCDYLVNNDSAGLREEFQKNSRTMRCVDYIKMRDKSGNNLIHMAVIYGCDSKVFKVMIEEHNLSDMMYKTNNAGETPFRMAVRLNMRDPLLYFEQNINNSTTNALSENRDILRRNNELRTMCDVAHEKSKRLTKELEDERKKNYGFGSCTKRTRVSYERDRDDTELIKAKRRCTELERINERQKTEVKLVTETNDYLESENRKLQVQNREHIVECDRQLNRVKMIEIQNKEIALKNTNLITENTKLMSENKSLNITIKSLQEENNDLITKNKKLKTQVDSFVNASRRK